MGIVQVNVIANSLVGQALGREDLIGSDASFVSLGDDVLSTNTNTELVYSVLGDRIGRTVSAIRAYERQPMYMRREPMEWGIALQKISMPLSDAVENPAYLGIDDDSDGDVLKPANKKKPIQKLFSKVSTWEYDCTVFNNQLRQAFTSPEAMMAFLNMLFTAVYNSQELAFEGLDSMCRNSFIAGCANTPSRQLKLLTMYKAETGNTLTAEQALNNVDFLIWAAKTMSIYSKRMRKMSISFNDGTIERHTPRDLQHLTVLTDFSEAMSYTARSQVYNEELVQMQGFEEVVAWQSTQKGTWSFSNISSVSINNGEKTPTTTIQNVVGLLADYESYGTTIQRMDVSSMYNPRRKFTNYFYQAETGYFNDLSENGIIFTLT